MILEHGKEALAPTWLAAGVEVLEAYAAGVDEPVQSALTTHTVRALRAMSASNCYAAADLPVQCAPTEGTPAK
jgi:hypothetical protein